MGDLERLRQLTLSSSRREGAVYFRSGATSPRVPGAPQGGGHTRHTRVRFRRKRCGGPGVEYVVLYFRNPFDRAKRGVDDSV